MLKRGSRGNIPLVRHQGEALVFPVFTHLKTCPPGRAERAGRHDFMQDVEFADGQKHALKRKIRRLITFYIMAHPFHYTNQNLET